MQGKHTLEACAELVPPVTLFSAPPSPCSPSHLSNPHCCVAPREFFANIFLSSLHRGIALLIPRLTLESQTMDRRLRRLFDPRRHNNLH